MTKFFKSENDFLGMRLWNDRFVHRRDVERKSGDDIYGG